MITKLPTLRPGPSNRRELLCEVQSNSWILQYTEECASFDEKHVTLKGLETQ